MPANEAVKIRINIAQQRYHDTKPHGLLNSKSPPRGVIALRQRQASIAAAESIVCWCMFSHLSELLYRTAARKASW
ncbi:hypothetical protein PILCRDRAFT_826643 [Piloderma croceum F 1598]|uniref:Uncharacterized protein n=1 Tax=Piloderma croceum (strain F 1598) TaxID=765440 RepID=A0A0C3EUE5_PILCF|nr:hypothetical protein PILCRDRAFT_826643 [Piloderma croceum F 1598]